MCCQTAVEQSGVSKCQSFEACLFIGVRIQLEELLVWGVISYSLSCMIAPNFFLLFFFFTADWKQNQKYLDSQGESGFPYSCFTKIGNIQAERNIVENISKDKCYNLHLKESTGNTAVRLYASAHKYGQRVHNHGMTNSDWPWHLTLNLSMSPREICSKLEESYGYRADMDEEFQGTLYWLRLIFFILDFTSQYYEVAIKCDVILCQNPKN